jgi:hypothetical protein
MTTSPAHSYAGYRFPAEVISYAVYLYFRFSLSLRMVEEMLAVRGIEVSHETVRKWGLRFGREIANGIRCSSDPGPDAGHRASKRLWAGGSAAGCTAALKAAAARRATARLLNTAATRPKPSPSGGR